jgi:hypothetical protein
VQHVLFVADVAVAAQVFIHVHRGDFRITTQFDIDGVNDGFAQPFFANGPPGISHALRKIDHRVARPDPRPYSAQRCARLIPMSP